MELIEAQIRALFERKGERIVNANLHAFRKGDAAARFTSCAAGEPASLVKPWPESHRIPLSAASSGE
jgi:hypothetical protein